MASIFTTPPPRRPPPPKHPLFTKKLHSTTSFSPGHIVGLGVLGLGIYGMSKFLIARGHADAAQTLREASRAPQASQVPGRPAAEPKLAQIENTRGQYGGKP